MTLAFPTSWGFQSNLGFTFTISYNGLSGPPLSDTPDACLASVVFLSHRETSYHSFLISLALKPEPVAEAPKFCSLMGLKLAPLVQLHLYQLSFCCRWFPSELKLFFNSFLQIGSLTGWVLLWSHHSLYFNSFVQLTQILSPRTGILEYLPSLPSFCIPSHPSRSRSNSVHAWSLFSFSSYSRGSQGFPFPICLCYVCISMCAYLCMYAQAGYEVLIIPPSLSHLVFQPASFTRLSFLVSELQISACAFSYQV